MTRISSALYDEKAEIFEKAERAFESIRLFYTNGNRERFAKSLTSLRRELKLSQREFAERYGLDLASLRNWEQRRTEPDKAVQSYLNAISQEPDRIAKAVRKAKLFELILEDEKT